MIRQEHLGAQWAVKDWLKAHKVSIKKAAELAGVSDTIIHVWDSTRRTPFSFWKFCQVEFGTEEKARSPKLIRPTQPYRVTEPMWRAAIKFDQKYQGTTMYVEPAGTAHEIVAPSAEQLEQALMPVPATPVAGAPIQTDNTQLLEQLLARMPAARAATAATTSQLPQGDELDVLLNLMFMLKGQRDTLVQQNYSLQSQLEQVGADRVELEQLRIRVVALQTEVTAFRNMADDATAPGSERVLTLRSKPEAAARVADLVARRAPALLAELQRLPLQA